MMVVGNEIEIASYFLIPGPSHALSTLCEKHKEGRPGNEANF